MADLGVAGARWDGDLGEYVLEWEDVVAAPRTPTPSPLDSPARPSSTPAPPAAGTPTSPPAPKATRRPSPNLRSMIIGFVGSGSMAAAIARGLAGEVDGMLFSDSGSGRAAALAEELGGEALPNEEVAARADAILLAVKPAALDAVAPSLQDAEEIVSVLAATPLARLREAFPDAKILRTMPNVGVEVRRGVICVAGDASPEVRAALEEHRPRGRGRGGGLRRRHRGDGLRARLPGAGGRGDRRRGRRRRPRPGPGPRADRRDRRGHRRAAAPPPSRPTSAAPSPRPAAAPRRA